MHSGPTWLRATLSRPAPACRTLGGALLASLVLATAGCEEQQRHGIGADLSSYPQTDPKTTLHSAIKALEDGRADYVLAQLTAPGELDEAVRRSGLTFQEIVAKSRLTTDSRMIDELRWFSQSGAWKIQATRASLVARGTPPTFPNEGLKGATLTFLRTGSRWYVGSTDYAHRESELDDAN